MVVIVWKQSDIADLIRELVDFQSNKALAFFSRLFFWSHIRKTGRNTEENVTGISRDCSSLELDYRYRRGTAIAIILDKLQGIFAKLFGCYFQIFAQIDLLIFWTCDLKKSRHVTNTSSVRNRCVHCDCASCIL
ncbi:hypothetical protein T4B_10712 [Trichinella pseudospiralis]|uniref:Uncharacterized protein n=1 Tax=Trichinella pseudospiralis TaxID=6337 RepID=A0A0V1JAS1_TRIPS|nr:hypothetical protein T4B_10712 [Trichinella pseudospiralis]